MGNTDSAVASGVKKQAGPTTQDVYKFVDIKGGGELVEMMKVASKTKNYTEVDDFIQNRVVNYLYNGGQGRLIPTDHLVLLRNRDRPKQKLLEANRRVMDENGEFPPLELEDEDPTLDWQNYDKQKYRFCCFKLEETGAVNEGILLLCMLNATSIHNELAKRLLHFFPRLINDIYMADEYYGENVLHIAIVNEDPAMVKYMLNYGVDVHERCFGNFMCPEDQKSSRTDVLGTEIVQVAANTNYKGYVYWGEYPLSFAACLGQEECYRLILARGADPDTQDTNGNTTAHMLVIYDKMSMFDLVYECGARIDMVNRLGMTPLTLAAKLAKKDIFFHILKVQREIYWQIGHITCAAHPLPGLDSIDMETGKIDRNSALNLIAFGENLDHLDMLDGVIVDLLVAKWNAFVKTKFKRMMILFGVYFLLNLACFTLRPGPCMTGVHKVKKPSRLSPGLAQTEPPGTPPPALTNTSDHDLALPDHLLRGTATTDLSTPAQSATPTLRNETNATDCGCTLWMYSGPWDAVRWTLEALVLVGTIAYVLNALNEARFLGLSMFIENLTTVPSRVIFLLSCLLKLAMVVLRLACLQAAEDVLAVLVMLGTAPYFLFFCRGYKSVGPFVTMIYKMIVGDLLRFVTIYTVFVMGFSQAYFIIYRSYKHPDGAPNPMATPIQSIMLMFLASMNSFGDLYNNLKYTRQRLVGQILFILYMVSVAILLINMLIAMMGNTYQKIAEMKNEWMRQWARIVLVVERGVSPTYRLEHLKLYSKPMADGTPALILRIQQSDEEMEEMKDIMEMRIRHDRNVRRRQQKLLAEENPGMPLPQDSTTSVRNS
ncbi:transient receptor potential cation channel subfamily V member 5-like [Pollicipes pollicipes]|uniref:transient receptor potential cation channel subfamily V member 5-like n=1 Tax=Pollicipes pollicipes TaxID=41117 RepID=UPI00188514D2|nr:transient receptor potential cation channel subfamily V member 5-like [Pollicipes pollicipes]